LAGHALTAAAVGRMNFLGNLGTVGGVFGQQAAPAEAAPAGGAAAHCSVRLARAVSVVARC